MGPTVGPGSRVIRRSRTEENRLRGSLYQAPSQVGNLLQNGRHCAVLKLTNELIPTVCESSLLVSSVKSTFKGIAFSSQAIEPFGFISSVGSVYRYIDGSTELFQLNHYMNWTISGPNALASSRSGLFISSMALWYPRRASA